MSYKLFRQLVFEHLRQYLVSFLLILLAQLGLVILLREKFGKVATVIELKPPTLQVLFVLCLFVLVVVENLGIMKLWTNSRYRMLPVPATQLYFVNVVFAIFNQLVFFAGVVFGWLLWAKLFLPMFDWPTFASLGEFALGMVNFAVNLTVLWQSAVMLMLNVSQHVFPKLRPVIGIGCFVLISTVDSFITSIGRRLDAPITPKTDSYRWLWITPFEFIFTLISLGLIITFSIYLLQHYTEAESRKEHG